MAAAVSRNPPGWNARSVRTVPWPARHLLAACLLEMNTSRRAPRPGRGMSPRASSGSGRRRTGVPCQTSHLQALDRTTSRANGLKGRGRRIGRDGAGTLSRVVPRCAAGQQRPERRSGRGRRNRQCVDAGTGSSSPRKGPGQTTTPCHALDYPCSGRTGSCRPSPVPPERIVPSATACVPGRLRVGTGHRLLQLPAPLVLHPAGLVVASSSQSARVEVDSASSA